MTLMSAISHSCNVYSTTSAIGLRPPRVLVAVDGFRLPTGIDLPGESAGHVPEPGTPQAIQLAAFNEQQVASSSKPVWHSGETLNFAIGQSTLAVTPLQIVRLTAAIANGGELVMPASSVRFTSGQANGVGSGRLETFGTCPAANWHSAASARLKWSWLGRTGTGRQVQLKVNVAGKTGTAEIGGQRSRSVYWLQSLLTRCRSCSSSYLMMAAQAASEAWPLAKKLTEKMLDERLIAPTGKPLISFRYRVSRLTDSAEDALFVNSASTDCLPDGSGFVADFSGTLPCSSERQEAGTCPGIPRGTQAEACIPARAALETLKMRLGERALEQSLSVDSYSQNSSRMM